MMLPGDIEQFGYGNEAIFLDLEQRIMSDIVRRIEQTGVITRSADYQLNELSNLGYSDAEIKNMLKDALNASDEYIDHVYDLAVHTDYIDNKEMYKAMGKKFTPYEKNLFLQQYVESVKRQTKDDMINITKTMGFVVNSKDGVVFKKLSKYYKETLDKAMSDLATGSFDYNTTLRKTVSQMTNSGIRWVDYTSGHHNRIVVASRRSVFTGLTQLSQHISNYNAEQLGTDDFEVAWHANARPTHRWWQGKVWSKDELVSVCGLGTIEGLCGSNCYHVYYPFVEGISKRNWTDGWLSEQNEKEDARRIFEGKGYNAYEATQRQRILETRMRAQREAIKLLKDGKGDELDILSLQAKYRSTLDEYAKFSKVMDLRQQKERIYMDGLGKLGISGSIELKSKILKGYNTAINKGDISSFVKFEDYRKVARKIDKELVGTTTKDGIIISGYKTHFIDRIIGQYESSNEPIKEKRKGVKIESIKNALKQGELKIKVDKKTGKKSTNYTTNECIVSINPDTKMLIQTTPKK